MQANASRTREKQKKGIVMTNPVSILLRRRSAIFVNPTSEQSVSSQSFKVVSDLENRLQRLGYTLGEGAVIGLLASEAGRLAHYANDIFQSVSQLLGAVDANGNAAPVKPMYPNFPRQVEQASDTELYLNAILHYLGDDIGVRIMPEYGKLDRGETARTRDLRVIGALTDLDAALTDIFAGLVGQKAAWSDLDRDDIRYLLGRNLLKTALSGTKGYLDDALVAPEFGSKANLAWFIAGSGDPSKVRLASSFTDVLRVAVAVAGGNPEFVKPVDGEGALGNIPRPWRTAIVERLDSLTTAGADYGDIRRRLGLWKLVGKLLHVGEFKRFTRANELFTRIRKGDLPVSDRGLIQSGTLTQSHADMLRADRPGEFARDLDWALRTSSAPHETLLTFAKVAHNASSRTLWGAYNALENRDASVRMFLPKGNAARAQFSREPLPALDPQLVEKAKVIVLNALRQRYAAESPVGLKSKVFIDPALNGYAVPFQLRDQGLATRVIGRGSRLPIEGGEYLRFFVWWKDIEGGGWGDRVDLDLSLSFLNEQFEVVSEVAYYNLSNGSAIHSGDITSAPEGAAEYIDIKREELARLGGKSARYVAASILSFTHQEFKTIPEAVAGVMLRENLDQGEVFDGKTVETAFSLTQDSTGVVPFLYDLKTRELVWVGLATTLGGGRYTNYAGAHRSKFGEMAEAFATRKPVTIGQLIELHAKARGAIVVANAEDADEVYGPDTAFQAEKLLTDWL